MCDFPNKSFSQEEECKIALICGETIFVFLIFHHSPEDLLVLSLDQVSTLHWPECLITHRNGSLLDTFRRKEGMVIHF